MENKHSHKISRTTTNTLHVNTKQVSYLVFAVVLKNPEIPSKLLIYILIMHKDVIVHYKLLKIIIFYTKIKTNEWVLPRMHKHFH